MKNDELREQHVKVERIKELCNWCLEDWPCAVVRLLDENAKLVAALSRVADCPSAECVLWASARHTLASVKGEQG